MSHFSCTIDKSISDIEIFEKRLRETKFALNNSERQSDKNYNLNLTLETIEKIKFLDIKINNKIKTKTQEALRVLF